MCLRVRVHGSYDLAISCLDQREGERERERERENARASASQTSCWDSFQDRLKKVLDCLHVAPGPVAAVLLRPSSGAAVNA